MTDDLKEVGHDTARHDLLMQILQELREMRREKAKWDHELDERIARIERELDFIRNELQNQGTLIDGLRAQCRKRLDICHGRRSDGGYSTPPPAPASIEEEL